MAGNASFESDIDGYVRILLIVDSTEEQRNSISFQVSDDKGEVLIDPGTTGNRQYIANYYHHITK